jgi:hypothetical protein
MGTVFRLPTAPPTATNRFRWKKKSVARKKQTQQAATQNPTVQQILRAFGGEIVDIKMQ